MITEFKSRRDGALPSHISLPALDDQEEEACPLYWNKTIL